MNRKVLNIIISISIVFSVLFAYQNLYDNSFHFDDSHTIQDNPYIRDISNLPKFFTLGSQTFSSLPANQVYRPVVTSTLAIDYWLSQHFSDSKNGYDVHFYHYSMMITYILLLVLLFAFFLKIFNITRKHRWNIYFAFFATAFFGLHTINAETINYIISRSDLLSTFFVIAAFDIFIYFPKLRKWGIFLIPFLLGMFTKLTSAMFIPLLISYYYIFEYLQFDIVTRKIKRKELLLQSLLLISIMLALVVFVMKMQSDTFVPGTHSRWHYLITMPYVLLHYFISFFYPYKLSADTDWTVITSVLDIRFFIGMLFILLMMVAFIISIRNRKLAPISFGILWFFFTLAPTSSFIPLAEVMNDHRMFYPLIGFTFAIVYLVSIFIVKKEYKIRESRVYQSLLSLIILGILGGHFYGVRVRTEVWQNGKSLWYDVTIKSPKNGRGLMNYGLQLMAEQKYDEAMTYYKKAEVYSPYYSYLFTNMAICYNAMGDEVNAEVNYKKSLQYGYYNHKTHYYYATFLLGKKRYKEAIEEYKISLEMSPKYIYSKYKLMEIYSELQDWVNLRAIVADVISDFPNDATAIYYADLVKGKMTKLELARKNAKTTPSADAFIELSLYYYKANKFDSSLFAAEQILNFDKNNPVAYINICAANNVLGNWDAAIRAGEKALRLDPGNQLAKNNLAVSYRRKKMQQKLDNEEDANKLIDLSLSFYNEGLYKHCVKTCQKIIDIDSNNSIAYNNMCSAYNALKDWDNAIKAGEMAVKLSPESELAKNNLKLAKNALERTKSK
jgi:tetratricopeptide (TPR) repeat protein